MNRNTLAWPSLVFLFACVFCSGCTIPKFEHPIESLDEATVPTELFGSYKALNAPEFSICNLLIEKADEGTPRGVFRFTMEEQPLGSPEKRTTRGFCIATRFDRSYVVQVPMIALNEPSDGPPYQQEVWCDAEIEGYLFIRVRIDADELELAMIDTSFLVRAIDQGKLRGSVKRSAVPKTVEPRKTKTEIEAAPESRADSITVTAESDALRLFIQENIERGLFLETDNPRYKREK